jgi:hypothetical protein
MPAALFDYAELLQFAASVGTALAAHAQHIGDQFLDHGQAAVQQAVQGQQPLAAC